MYLGLFKCLGIKLFVKRLIIFNKRQRDLYEVRWETQRLGWQRRRTEISGRFEGLGIGITMIKEETRGWWTFWGFMDKGKDLPTKCSVSHTTRSLSGLLSPTEYLLNTDVLRHTTRYRLVRLFRQRTHLIYDLLVLPLSRVVTRHRETRDRYNRDYRFSWHIDGFPKDFDGL